MPPSAAPTNVQLPRAVLTADKLSLTVLSYVPLPIVKRYQIAAFAQDNSVLSLAIVHPEQLKPGYQQALATLSEKIGLKLNLVQTDQASMQMLIKQYQQMLKQSNDKGGPPVFRLGKTVAFKYLNRVPLEFCKEYHLACVDFSPPNTYWFVVDGSQEKYYRAIFDFLGKQNDITIRLIQVASKDLDLLLEHYASKIEAPPAPAPTPAPVAVQTPEPKEEPKAELKEEEIVRPKLAPIATASETAEAEKAPESVKVPPPIVGSQEMLTPEIQASIITAEEEKPGLGGLLQRFSQNFMTPDQDDEDKPVLDLSAFAESSPEAAAEPAALPRSEKAEGQAGDSANPTAPAAEAPASKPVADAPAAPTISSAVAINSEESTDIGSLLDKQIEGIDQLRDHLKKGIVPQIVAAIVSYAIFMKASDVHFEAFEDELRVRYRVDGQLLDIVKLPADVHAAIVSRIKILSRLRLDENRIPQDGRFDVKFNHAEIDVRVSVMPTVHGEKVVLRLLDKSQAVHSLETLGVMGKGYQDLFKSITKPYGICLATGPTGSGKSTTLYAILNRVATPNINVMTLEDPVEYEIKGINQAQVRPKIGFTFAEGLRSVLRQDPNIIMVGEIRDGETANMATQAALTGHMVLSTLHTNDAAGAVPRLTNMGVEPFLINSALNMAMGQRLVRRICPNCKAEMRLPQSIEEQFKRDLEVVAKLNPIDAKRIPSEIHFYQGTGCDQCQGNGYRGRLGIYEVLVISDAVEEIILARGSRIQIQEQAQREGMLTMYQDGLLKVVDGVTTVDEILRTTANK